MKTIIVSFLSALMFSSFLQGCLRRSNDIPLNSDKIQMIKTDEAFSNMSRQYGVRKAFLEYMDEEGILLGPEHMPVVGADAIELLSQANDSAYTLTWKSSGAEISSSGDLGFTYGVYLLALTDTALSGTYVNIWKKQADGKWKFILDSGHEGIRSNRSLQ